jgi:hypothetical protein
VLGLRPYHARAAVVINLRTAAYYDYFLRMVQAAAADPTAGFYEFTI